MATRKDSDNCGELTPTTPTIVLGNSGRRPLPVCDDVVITTTPTITPVDDAPPVTTTLSYFLTILSEPVTVTCSQFPGIGQDGTPVTLPTGSEVSTVDISFLSDSSLSLLLTDVAKANVLSLAIAGNDVSIASQYGTSKAQALTLVSLVQIAQLAVNQAAFDKAAAAIDCAYVNAQVILTCPAGALSESSPTPVANNPVVVAEGTFRSAESQGEADNRAYADASARLVCVFPSDEITVTCLSEYGLVGVSSDVNLPPYGERRVASVTVAAGTYRSTESIADANQMAQEAAVAELRCFYLNAQTLVVCPDPQHIHDRPVTYQSGLPGTDITVLDGYFASSNSQAEADALAVEAATDRLDCQFGNAPITVSCPVVPVRFPDGEMVDIYPSATSPVPSVTTPENVFQSPVSQADADDAALTDAESRLDCIYCNPIIFPRCVEPAVLNEITLGTRPVPLDALEASWSMDTTIGTAADAFCGPDASSVVAQATAAADTPVRQVQPGSSEVECLYGNDILSYKCQAPAIPLGTFGKPIADQQLEIVVGANAFTIAITQVPDDFMPGSPDNERAKGYANRLALEFAKSTLQCVFYNEYREVTCRVDKLLLDVDPRSEGSDIKPVIIKAGEVYSEKSFEDVVEIALTLGKSQLNCYYTSRPATFYCGDNVIGTKQLFPDGHLTYGDGLMTPTDGSYNEPSAVSPKAKGSIQLPVKVEAGVAISFESQLDADDQAASVGIGDLDCFWYNVPVIVKCGAPGIMPWNFLNEEGNTPVDQGTGDGTILGNAGAVDTPVVLLGGFQQSTISKYDATKSVYDIAKATLNCEWASAAVYEECPNLPRDDGKPSRFADPSKSSASAPAGFFTSTTSAADATNRAIEAVRGALQCVYTNDLIVYDPEGKGGDQVGGGGGGSGAPGNSPKVGSECGNSKMPVGILSVDISTFLSQDPNIPNQLARAHINTNQQCVSDGGDRDPFTCYTTDDDLDDDGWPVLKFAWGTGCEAHKATGGFNISNLDTPVRAKANQLFFLKTEFTIGGSVSSCVLTSRTPDLTGNWPSSIYPSQFAADGLTWYHPIAHIRPARDDRETRIQKDGYVIAQLEDNHLRVARACGMDDAMTVHWKLEPGPGAII